MKKNSYLLLLCLVLGCLSSCQNGDKEQGMKANGPQVIDFKVLAFPLQDVHLLDGPFKHATELDIRTLLNYEPDRFLSKFRKNAGLKPKAESYGGWEGESLAGHSLGHYMNAISFMYLTTGNKEFLRRANYIVDQLDSCQQVHGTGYIGAFDNGEEILTQQVAKGDIKSQGFNLNGLWSPFYVIHKLLDGLYHVHKYCNNPKALEVEKKLADWIGTVVDGLSHEQMQEVLHCEFGGMNDALAQLYGATGNKKYLDLSKKFHHDAIIDPIEEGKDILAGKHCNTQIPKFVGLANRYELTGDTADHRGAVNFWNMMVYHHAYVAGDFDNYEYLDKSDELNDELSDNTAETCCVYNMLKLSRHLFEWTGSAKIMDYYERALINHILSSQHPVTGKVIYNLSLDMGGFKVYEDPYGFTCCVGTGMENHSKYGRNIYYHSQNTLYLAQFIGSTLNWKEKDFQLRQVTDYPEEQGTSLTITTAKADGVNVDLKVRYPEWAQKGIHVTLNGKKLDIKGTPGSFVSLGTKWKNGDQLHISLPFTLREESMPDNHSRIAIFNGPVLLAGILGPIDDPEASKAMYVPVLMTKDTLPEHWMEPVPGKTNTFKTVGVGNPRQVTLQPFYRTQDIRYTVYWDTYSAEEWKTYQKQYKAEQEKKKALEASTIDLFRVGEMQPERNHEFKATKSWVGEYKSKKYREINRGGTASFVMKIDKGTRAALVFEYWGGFSGSHTFDIKVEGNVIATENITDKAPGKFINVTYKIPVPLTYGKSKIKVELVPHDGHRAGPLFTARTIRQ